MYKTLILLKHPHFKNKRINKITNNSLVKYNKNFQDLVKLV